MRELLDADGLGQQRDQAEDVLGLGRGAGDHLMRHVRHGRGMRVEAVAQLGVAEHEAALVRHVHVVEDHHGVGFLEPGAERVVVPRPSVVERLAGQVAQSVRVVRDGAGEGVLLVLRRVPQHRGREHQQLVGERADGGEHPGAADDDAVVVLAHDVRHQRSAGLLAAGDRAVGLRRDQRVRAEEILLADLLVVAADVLAVLRARLAEPLLCRGERHQRAVQVVAGAAQHAERAVGPELERLAALDEIICCPRLQEGRRHGLACRG